jgi:hypothetical protein
MAVVCTVAISCLPNVVRTMSRPPERSPRITACKQGAHVRSAYALSPFPGTQNLKLSCGVLGLSIASGVFLSADALAPSSRFSSGSRDDQDLEAPERVAGLFRLLRPIFTQYT